MSKETFYLAKYALSVGIKEVQGVRNDDYVYGLDGFLSFHSFRIGRDIFESRAEAVAQANKLRTAKLASLKRQIKKLEEQVFA